MGAAGSQLIFPNLLFSTGRHSLVQKWPRFCLYPQPAGISNAENDVVCHRQHVLQTSLKSDAVCQSCQLSEWSVAFSFSHVIKWNSASTAMTCTVYSARLYLLYLSWYSCHLNHRHNLRYIVAVHHLHISLAIYCNEIYCLQTFANATSIRSCIFLWFYDYHLGWKCCPVCRCWPMFWRP